MKNVKNLLKERIFLESYVINYDQRLSRVLRSSKKSRKFYRKINEIKLGFNFSLEETIVSNWYSFCYFQKHNKTKGIPFKVTKLSSTFSNFGRNHF